MVEETDNVYEPTEEMKARAHIKSMDEYRDMYNESINNPDEFWGKMAEEQYTGDGGSGNPGYRSCWFLFAEGGARSGRSGYTMDKPDERYSFSGNDHKRGAFSQSQVQLSD